jgi:hypothetical protein
LLRFTAMTGLVALAILAILIAGSDAGWFDDPSFSREILAFFSLSNVTLYWAVGRNLSDHPDDFVKVYLGATVLRILFFGGFILAVILLDRSGAAGNTLFFLVCYFLFTIMEVGALWLKIKS